MFCFFIQATFQHFDRDHAIVTGSDCLILKGITGCEPVCIAVCSMFSYKGGAWRESLTADDAIGFIYLFIYLLFFVCGAVLPPSITQLDVKVQKFKNRINAFSSERDTSGKPLAAVSS